jgi:hypothetical protein
MDALIELDSRMSGGVQVTLLWHRLENSIWVEVMNWETDERFTVATPPERALEVFMHPFAYAPSHVGQLVFG